MIGLRPLVPISLGEFLHSTSHRASYPRLSIRGADNVRQSPLSPLSTLSSAGSQPHRVLGVRALARGHGAMTVVIGGAP